MRNVHLTMFTITSKNVEKCSSQNVYSNLASGLSDNGSGSFIWGGGVDWGILNGSTKWSPS